MNTQFNKLIKHPEHFLSFGDLKIKVFDGVFTPNPELTYSSSIILDHFHNINVKNKIILDVGTGTGLLAIKSSLCGAEKVFATDLSLNALRNAEINIHKNKVENVELLQTNLVEGIHQKFDVIFANLPIEGVLWNVDQKSLMNSFFSLVSNNYKKNTEIYIPWGSFKASEKRSIEYIFEKYDWNYEICREVNKIGHTWWLYKLTKDK